jgi:hypothetical protein
MEIYVNIFVRLDLSLNSPYNEKCFTQSLYIESKHTRKFNNFFFFENRTVCEKNVEKCCTVSQATDGKMAHAHCMVDI